MLPIYRRAIFVRVRQVLGTVAALGIAVSAQTAGAQQQQACQATVDQRLVQLAIDAGDVSRMQFSPTFQEDSEGNRRSTGTDVWIRLQSCEGAVVIDLGRTCRVRQVYTRGACRLPGIKSFR